LGRRVAVIDSLGHQSRTEYDKVGNTIAKVDANGNRTEFFFDALNRQIKVKDAKGNFMTKAFDKVGDLLSITDREDNTTTYTYDALNRRLTDTNAFGKARIYSYDVAGNNVSVNDRNGNAITYIYDGLNRLINETWLDANGNPINSIISTYDVIGQRLSVGDSGSKYTYDYDINGRLISIDNAGTNGIPNVLLTYVYDKEGRLVLVKDKINGQEAGLLSYGFDALDRVTQIKQSGNGVRNKRLDFAFNPSGQVSNIKCYSDLMSDNLVVDTTFSYNGRSALLQIEHRNASGFSLASYQYTYDAASRITSITSKDDYVTYAYDDTNQLTGANHSNQNNEVYNYDANGNRSSVGYQTGVNNRLISDGVYTYEYDDEGNRTKRTELSTGNVNEYQWDHRNRLTRIFIKDATNQLMKRVEYTYDVNNQRIGKIIDGIITERYSLDRNQISLVFDGQGNQVNRYLYGAGVDQVMAEENVVNTRWFLSDHLGTVKDIIDNQGIILDHIVYDTYGKIINQVMSGNLRYSYTGREWDDEVGQYYYRARYYDQNIGEFISEDPLGFSAGDINLNRYVNNDPVSSTDPSGEAPVKAAIANSGASISRNVRARLTNSSTYDSSDVSELKSLSISKIEQDRFYSNIIYHRGDLSRSYMPHESLLFGQRKQYDQRGHILPHVLGGTLKDYVNNYFWQDPGVNQGAYGTFGKRISELLEGMQAEALRNTSSTLINCFPIVFFKYEAIFQYGDAQLNLRPSRFTVIVTPTVRTFSRFLKLSRDTHYPSFSTRFLNP
jgi:RHS repeat-associated protein